MLTQHENESDEIKRWNYIFETLDISIISTELLNNVR